MPLFLQHLHPVFLQENPLHLDNMQYDPYPQQQTHPPQELSPSYLDNSCSSLLSDNFGSSSSSLDSFGSSSSLGDPLYKPWKPYFSK